MIPSLNYWGWCQGKVLQCHLRLYQGKGSSCGINWAGPTHPVQQEVEGESLSALDGWVPRAEFSSTQFCLRVLWPHFNEVAFGEGSEFQACLWYPLQGLECRVLCPSESQAVIHCCFVQEVPEEAVQVASTPSKETELLEYLGEGQGWFSIRGLFVRHIFIWKVRVPTVPPNCSGPSYCHQKVIVFKFQNQPRTIVKACFKDVVPGPQEDQEDGWWPEEADLAPQLSWSFKLTELCIYAL